VSFVFDFPDWDYNPNPQPQIIEIVPTSWWYRLWVGLAWSILSYIDDLKLCRVVSGCNWLACNAQTFEICTLEL